MLQAIDGAVLERAEWFSHRLQRWTGLTNFWLARWMIIGILLIIPLWAMGIAILAPPTSGGILVAGTAVPVSIMLGVIGWAIWGVCLDMDQYYQSAPRVAHSGSMRWRQFWSIRVFALYAVCLFVPVEFLGPDLFRELRVLCWLCIPGHLYFMAVIPLPPGKSKVREFIERLVLHASPLSEGGVS